MNTRRQLLATIFGFAAIGFALLSLIYWVVILSLSGMDRLLQVFLIAAIVSFSIYLLAAPESVGRAAGRRSNRLTANALVVSLVAVGIAFLINVIAETAPAVRADWTAGQTFTLSDQSNTVLKELDKRNMSVKAVAFFSARAASSSGTSLQQIQDLLKEYASRSARIKYEVVDPDADPIRATQYGITKLGSVVFDNGTKREIAQNITEADFTGALVRLLQTGTKTVAFLTGHGERNTAGTDQAAFSQVKSALVKDNYNTITWNLAVTPTLTVSDVSVLVIAQPTKAYSTKEVQAVQSYVDGGGHLLLLLDPTMPADALATFSPMLQKYGVTAVPGGIVDPQSNYSQYGVAVVLETTYPSSSDITRGLSASNLTTVFPLSLGLKPPTSTVGGMQVTSIIQSSSGTLGSQPASWLETDLKSQNVAYDAGKDLPGPVSMAVSIAPATVTTDTVKSRLVVFGDADFASDGWLTQDPSNLDLFANSVSWLSGANELVSIRAKAADAPRTVPPLTPSQQSVLFFSTVVGLPLLVILMGAFVWWRRR
jgi:ABC-type uncharacterized transport system involved in gliding motility auxiliary subunit